MYCKYIGKATLCSEEVEQKMHGKFFEVLENKNTHLGKYLILVEAGGAGSACSAVNRLNVELIEDPEPAMMCTSEKLCGVV